MAEIVENRVLVRARGARSMDVDYRAWLTGLSVLAALLLAGGCASLPHPVTYPPEWVSSRGAPQPNGCPDLSGIYATRAADVHPRNAGTPPWLNEIFDPKGQGVGIFKARTADRHWPTLPGATIAAFKLDGDSLSVRFRDESLGEATLKFHRIHFVSADRGSDAFFDCHESEFGPALRFVGPSTPIRAWPYLFAEKDMEIMSLFKGADGSLIVNHRTDRVFFTSVLLGSQADTRGSAWWRYPPVEPKL